MILRFVLFALVLCLVAPAAEAQWWPFGKKNEESLPSKVFNDPAAAGGGPEKKWALDDVLNKPVAGDPDIVINGITVRGLKGYMMNASYAPKSVEEIAAITTAHNSWQAGAMEEMERKAQERIKTAERQSREGLKHLAADGSQHPVLQPDAGAETAPTKPSVPQIFNKPLLEKPGKVFSDY